MSNVIGFGLILFAAASAAQAQGLAQERTQGKDQDSAQHGQRKVFGSAHEVLALAIRDGSASGELSGEVAAHFNRQFNSTGPLRVEARAINDLAREGCKRVQLDTTKEAVPTAQGPRDLKLSIWLNYCLDGRPPNAVVVPVGSMK